MSESDTPRETCETCYGLGRVDAVYAPCPDCKLNAARAEVGWLKLKLTAARDEIEWLKLKLTAAHTEVQLKNLRLDAVKMERDRLVEALRRVMNWMDESGYYDVSPYHQAVEALQSLTPNP
jgi:hypothetical protein